MATPNQIAWHFLIGRYPNIKRTKSLEDSGQVIRVEVADHRHTKASWYVHSDDVDTAQAIVGGEWEPRTTLLSPFDNLIIYRERTHELFNYFFRIEIYTPKAKRRQGSSSCR